MEELLTLPDKYLQEVAVTTQKDAIIMYSSIGFFPKIVDNKILL
jgi:hypothetical protein